MTRKKPAKGKKADAYKLAAKAFKLLGDCADLLDMTLNAHSEDMSEEAFVDLANAVGMLRKVTSDIHSTSIKPANAEIEVLSKRNAIGGHVLKVDEETIGKDGFNEALKRHADERHRDGKRAATGWKEGIAKHLGLSAWKYVKPRLYGWGYDEKYIVELLKEEDRKNESR